jgi:hypothetical protein
MSKHNITFIAFGNKLCKIAGVALPIVISFEERAFHEYADTEEQIEKITKKAGVTNQCN